MNQTYNTRVEIVKNLERTEDVSTMDFRLVEKSYKREVCKKLS